MGAALIPASHKARNPLLRSVAAVALAGALAGVLPLMIASCTSDAPVDSRCPSAQPTCANNAPSYKDEIAPILAQHCFECHSDGGLAERKKSFDDYAHVKDAAGVIYRNVYGCVMPRQPEPQPPLSPEDKQKLLLWLKCDAPNN